MFFSQSLPFLFAFFKLRTMRNITLIIMFALSVTTMIAQDNSGYQMPPKAISDLIDAAPTPGVSISPDRQWMILRDRPSLPSIEEVSQPELRLAGLRLNPQTNGQSRSTYETNLRVRRMGEEGETAVKGLPKNARIRSLSWSTDSKMAVFMNTVSNGNELWKLDLATATASRVEGIMVNNSMRNPYAWLPDGKTLIVNAIDANRGAKPEKPNVPKGPVIQSNEGNAAPVRTYQDMLRNPFDEDLFEYFTSSELTFLDMSNGNKKSFVKGIIRRMQVAPNGEYILVTQMKRPFSYIVPYYRFPMEVNLYDKNGTFVRQLADLPAAENLPKGFNAVATGPRSFQWRSDIPAELYWVEAQDGGDPKKEADVRDRLFALSAPFDGKPKPVLDYSLRYGGVDWGNDEVAITYEWWRADRREVTRRWQPGNTSAAPEVLFDRSYEDRYGDPGAFETVMNEHGHEVLQMADNGQSLILMGQGASPEGNRPFVDKYALSSKKSERMWQSEAPYYERPIYLIDEDKGELLTLRQAQYENPNFFIQNLKSGKTEQVTQFPNPFESMNGVSKELVKFKRADGLDLTGTLYLPAGYDPEKDGTLPVIMWAYPREYKSASAASQVTTSPHAFIRTSWASPTLWLSKGYAVFDRVAMPVIGEGEEEPNERFVEQLKANAEAAIDVLVERGVADRDRIGIGGHSYGAFMTANLLAHTDLFAAGIARSGAYNRTLTPFGFQAEERTYWETPETYYKMSPFNFADKIKEPILLIHGEADNNSGTFPMQSERMYAALKGHGATARLVMLPAESHGYRARESIMHMAWEMDQWLDKYVKKESSNP